MTASLTKISPPPFLSLSLSLSASLHKHAQLPAFYKTVTDHLEYSEQSEKITNPELGHTAYYVILRWLHYTNELINPLNPELNPICYLLALLGAHHFLHVSRIRVKSLTFRRLMSYIYGAPNLDVSRSHTTTQHSR